MAVQGGAHAYLVDWAGELDPAWFVGARQVGITAGASAPEVLVDDVVRAVQRLVGGAIVNQFHEPEGVSFPLPKALA